MESILTSSKRFAGLGEDYEHFDPEIIMYINSSLLNLKQIGIGPSEGFVISDESDMWEDFIPDNGVIREAAKEFVGTKVRLKFDPPLNASVLESLRNNIKEAEWRLCTEAELLNTSGEEEIQNGE